MRILILILSFLIIPAAFATMTPTEEGGVDPCILEDGSFRQECIYMSRPPIAKMSPRAALQKGTWTIVSLNGKAITASGTLQFTKHAFTANLCNTVAGKYSTFLGERLFLRNTISTKMYCEGDIMKVEDAMSFRQGIFIVGDYDLTITTKKGDVIVWKKK
jgi:heat shock protein HslJ